MSAIEADVDFSAAFITGQLKIIFTHFIEKLNAAKRK